MYEEVISWWLYNSSFDIFLADSANNKFNEDIESKCSTFHYDQTLNSINPRRHSDTTNLEGILLKLAGQYFKQEWKNYDYIVKLTAKYTLPDLESELYKILLKYQLPEFLPTPRKAKPVKLINQHTCTPVAARTNINVPRTNQQTELFAIPSKYFTEVIDDLVSMSHEVMEERMVKLVNSEKYVRSKVNLPKLKNTSNFVREDTKILSAL
jgi:hypothetical protein